MSARESPRILVVDDQVDVLEALRLLLKPEGFAVTAVTSAAAAIAAARETTFDAALIDLNYARDTTSGKEGLDLLSALRAVDDALPVVVMTAWGTIDGAVEAMRRGARDYVQKPWENARLVATLAAQIELGRALRASRRPRAPGALAPDVPELYAASRAMDAVLRVVDRVGPSDANVLVTGEHGTGKEVVARRLHAVSLRRAGAFVAIDAGALAEALLESALFGHVKGAFTDARADRPGAFALAHRGTVFLDEIGNMPASQQAKLLRVLQSGEFSAVGSAKVERVDVRVIAATNADLGAEVKAGRFREDLLYRLNTVEIRLPPLRERREDVPLLAARFLARTRERYGKPAATLSPEAMDALLAHAWPGNVRELEHVVERAVLLGHGDRIEEADLGLRPATGPTTALDHLTLEQAERQVIERAIRRAAGNVNEAAKALGLSRSALYRRLQLHGIKVSG
jgi:DNA-binding NtrC family response regulator